MKRALFVSDVHIKASQDPKCEAFLRFLKRCREIQVDDLFLVGDIFDLWIADRDFFIANYALVVESLKALHDSGTRVHYFEGNHDLDLDVFWREQLGFFVYDRASFFEIGDYTVRVEHGDQMDPEDRGYLFLRWFLRTPLMRWMGRNLPNAWVKWIGEKASGASREYTTSIKAATDEQVQSKIERHAYKVFEKRPFDILVSGHVHVADDRFFVVHGAKFRSVNLGTWLREPLVFEIHGEKARLIQVSAL